MKKIFWAGFLYALLSLGTDTAYAQSDYFTQERDRLIREREQILSQQQDLRKKLDAINREFQVIEAYASRSPDVKLPQPAIPSRTAEPVLPFARSPNTDAAASRSMLPGIDITVSPRFWYQYSISDNGKPVRGASAVQTGNTVTIPMSGLAVSAKHAALPDTSFILSALYGRGKEEIHPLVVGDTQVGSGSSRVHRYDIELLAQTAIPDTNWGWLIGTRYEQESTASTVITFPAGGPPTQSDAPGALKHYTIKVGMAGAAPIGATDFRMFGNFLAFGGPETATKQGVVAGLLGPDLAVGVQYQIGSALSLDLRYRAIVSFLIGAPPGVGSYYLTHGPMLGLNIHF
jgi:hypothetical protein